MQRSIIWFVLAMAWGADCLLALFHHNRLQAGLTALFAACFLAVALFFRKRQQTSPPPLR